MRLGAIAVALPLLAVAGCGGAGGPDLATIGGTVTGLTGSGLVLTDNGGDPLQVSASGPFAFSARLPPGSAYQIAVQSQPTNPDQTCVVSGGSGTAAAGRVSDIAVACANAYSVGGAVSGLTGAGLVLQLNGGDDLALAASGAFAFPRLLAQGAAYAVTVRAQPFDPTQHCYVRNAGANGTVAAAGITSVAVACAGVGRFVYVAHPGSASVSAFSVDPATGAMTPVPGSPFWIGGEVVSVATNPSQTFAYVIGYDRVSALAIDPATGALTRVARGGPLPLPAPANGALAVDPSGRFIYVVSSEPRTGPCCPQLPGQSFVSAFRADPDTGIVTEVRGSPSPVGVDPQFIGVEPLGRFLYVSNRGSVHLGPGSQSIEGHAIDPGTGALGPGQGCDNPCGGSPIAFEPSGKFAYVYGTTPFTIDPATGALTPAGGVFPATGSVPAFTFDRSGRFAYGPGCTGGCAYAVDAENGTLTKTGASPGPAAFDPSDKFAFAACPAGLCAYGIDTASGVLSLAADAGFAAPAGHGSLTLHPGGAFAYVTNSSATDGVSAFSVDPASGALMAIAAAPVAAGDSPALIAADPLGDFVYVVSAPGATQTPAGPVPGLGTVATLGVDRTTGGLRAATHGPVGTSASPGAIAADPSGRFVYVANTVDVGLGVSPGAPALNAYAIDRGAGSLAQLASSPFLLGPGGGLTHDQDPPTLAIDSTGRFAYVSGPDGPAVAGTALPGISALNLDSATGSLSAVPGSPFAAGTLPVAVGLDPQSRFAYVADRASAAVFGYSIDPISGVPTPLAGSPYPVAQATLASVTVDPLGRFVYVGRYDGIASLAIGANGDLTASAVSPTQCGGGSFAVNARGRFAYATCQPGVWVYAIDATSGALQPIPGNPFAPTTIGIGPIVAIR